METLDGACQHQRRLSARLSYMVITDAISSIQQTSNDVCIFSTETVQGFIIHMAAKLHNITKSFGSDYPLFDCISGLTKTVPVFTLAMASCLLKSYELSYTIE
jgi:hypothetical protein